MLVARPAPTRGGGRRAGGCRRGRGPRARLPRQPRSPRGPRRDPAHAEGPRVWTSTTCSSAARELLAAVKAPLEEVKDGSGGRGRRALEFLGKGGIKPLEERHKRELTAREREGVGELLNVTESWLRDAW